MLVSGRNGFPCAIYVNNTIHFWYSFKFNIWFWYCWRIKNCVVKKVNWLLECFICCAYGAVCWEALKKIWLKQGFIKWLSKNNFRIWSWVFPSRSRDDKWLVNCGDFQVILGVSMTQDQCWYVQKTKKVWFMWCVECWHQTYGHIHMVLTSPKKADNGLPT